MTIRRRAPFWMAVLVAVGFGLAMVRSSVASVYTFRGHSMEPSFQDGQRVLVNLAAYDLRLPFSSQRLLATGTPRVGDVVLMVMPGSDVLLLKRVAAGPGETIGDVTVPADHWYVLGDHRERSRDSRHFGVVPRSAILGRLVARLF